MADLATQQRRVLDRLAAGEATAADGDRVDLGDLVVGDERLDAAGRLDVYARMYQARLSDALTALHPTVAAVVGASALPEFARAYFRTYPSRSPSLRQAGDRLVDFLERPPPGARARPALADVARLDAARLDAFDAADAATVALSTLRELTAGELPAFVLRLHPSARLLRLRYTADVVFRAIERGRRPARLRRSPRALLVWRRGSAVLHRRLDATEAEGLELVASTAPLGALCDLLAARVGEAAAGPAALRLLAGWATAGVLGG